MPSPLRDAGVLLEDIEDAATKVLGYAAGHSRQAVFTDAMRFDAILHNLHVIGEAVKRLPSESKERREDIPNVKSREWETSSPTPTSLSTST